MSHSTKLKYILGSPNGVYLWRWERSLHLLVEQEEYSMWIGDVWMDGPSVFVGGGGGCQLEKQVSSR